MRLWHQKLLPYLDRQRLLSQHRECCALRGKGWGKKHSVVDYVFIHNPAYLVAYHYCVMEEMERRGYHPDRVWDNSDWRGSILGEEKGFSDKNLVGHLWLDVMQMKKIIFPEHDNLYLKECMHLLMEKEAPINWERIKADGLVKVFSYADK